MYTREGKREGGRLLDIIAHSGGSVSSMRYESLLTP